MIKTGDLQRITALFAAQYPNPNVEDWCLDHGFDIKAMAVMATAGANSVRYTVDEDFRDTLNEIMDSQPEDAPGFMFPTAPGGDFTEIIALACSYCFIYGWESAMEYGRSQRAK